MEKKFELNLPDYPGYEQIVELPRLIPVLSEYLCERSGA